MFDKFVRRMGMKTDHGWDDPTVVGFVVIWGVFGYGIYLTIDAVINRFF